MVTLKDFLPDNIPTQKQVELLGQFLIENFEKEIGKNGKCNGEGAIEMAVRLLLELKTIRPSNKKVKMHEKVFNKMMGNPLEQIENLNITGGYL